MIKNVRCGIGRLTAIPAVHSVARFAASVNTVFKRCDTPPSAVAVELGQGAVDEIVKWMQDLGVGPDSVVKLPAMLGIVRRNRMIHPRFRTLVFELQRHYGLPLEALPPRVLRESIDYAGAALVCLSATDSIIEALRCSVEWGVPAFGIDLEEYASPSYEPILIEDPRSVLPSLSSYIRRNAPLASRSYDRYIDERRESVMIGRLKRLATDFGSVLCTGGLAHWERIESGIQDSTIAPVRALPKAVTGNYRRVHVDPLLAVQHMDIFPEVTTRFEQARFIPDRSIEPDRLYEGLKRGALTVAAEIAKPPERAQLGPFFQFLDNLCLVRQRPLPSVFDCMAAATAMVSKGYTTRLGKALMSRNIDWIDAGDEHGLPLLKASPPESEGRGLSGTGELVQVRGQGADGETFYIDGNGIGGCGELDTRPVSRIDQLREKFESIRRNMRSLFGHSWAWHPRENLLYGTGYQAAEKVFAKTRRMLVEPFVGSLHEGLDIKATLRSFVRGDNRPQVRRKRNSNYSYRDALQEPTVFLFSMKPKDQSASWDLALAAADLSPYVDDLSKYRHVLKERGNRFIANISLSEPGEAEPRLKPWGGYVKRLIGTTTFGNPANNMLQAARWVEGADYCGFPILNATSFSALAAHYSKTFGIHLDKTDWTSTLVLVAIPYAKKRVVVIAPESYRPPAAVTREARSRRIDLELVPLTQFPKERVAQIQRQYYFQALGGSGDKVPPELEAIMGETIDAHTDLLPEWIRSQRKPKTDQD